MGLRDGIRRGGRRRWKRSGALRRTCPGRGAARYTDPLLGADGAAQKRQHLAAALQTLMQDIREQEKPPATKKEMTLVDTAECAVKTTIVVEPM